MRRNCGAPGQQQLRNFDANVGAWNLNLWAYTLVELWAWKQPEENLVDRESFALGQRTTPPIAC